MSSLNEPEGHLGRVARSVAGQSARMHKAARRANALHEREVRRNESFLNREKRALEREQHRLRLEERWLRREMLTRESEPERWGVVDDVKKAFGVEAKVDAEVVETSGDSAPTPPPPQARLLSLASLLLAPGERENWLGELRTARWELRADTRARRRETWGYFQTLGKSFVTSWRYRGDGPTQEAL